MSSSRSELWTGAAQAGTQELMLVWLQQLQGKRWGCRPTSVRPRPPSKHPAGEPGPVPLVCSAFA